MRAGGLVESNGFGRDARRRRQSAAQQQALTRQIITELPAVRVIDRQAAMLPGVLNVIGRRGFD
jgi:hypothetical protein